MQFSELCECKGLQCDAVVHDKNQPFDEVVLGVHLKVNIWNIWLFIWFEHLNNIIQFFVIKSYFNLKKNKIYKSEIDYTHHR